MVRNGKIARLSSELRMELNIRLREGEQGQALLDWLNEQPETKTLMKIWFAGAAINKQNLSEWRRGGHQDWLRHEEARELEDCQELSDVLGARVAVELARVMTSLPAERDESKRWNRLKEVLPHLAELRRADHRGRRLRLEREQRDREETERLNRRIEQEVKREQTAPVLAAMMQGWLAKSFGGRKAGELAAELLAAAHHDLRVAEFEEKEAESQSASKRVKVRQTKKTEQHRTPHAGDGTGKIYDLRDAMDEAEEKGRGLDGKKSFTEANEGNGEKTGNANYETSNTEHRTPNIERGKIGTATTRRLDRTRRGLSSPKSCHPSRI